MTATWILQDTPTRRSVKLRLVEQKSASLALRHDQFERYQGVDVQSVAGNGIPMPIIGIIRLA